MCLCKLRKSRLEEPLCVLLCFLKGTPTNSKPSLVRECHIELDPLIVRAVSTYLDFLMWSSSFSSITEHIDFATPIQQPAMEPLCNGNLPTSMHTLDHLHGVSNRASLHYTGESQLTEVSEYSALFELLKC